MEALATARFADAIPAGRAIATTVPRQELTTVLEADGSAELTLEFVPQGADEPPTMIGIEWSQTELEALLGHTEGDVVTLTFDRDELAELFDDVEAHGLRTRAAIVAVAAVGALGSAAGIASAMPTTADTAGAPAASGGSLTTLVTDASTGAGYAASVTPSSVDSIVSDASTGGGYTPPSVTPTAADSMVTDVSTSGGFGAAPSVGHETFGVQMPDTSDTILVGGVVLALAGATFVSRRLGAARPA